ncbi:MAG: winged helix-turn-helix domain-containing protein, partial [Hylemonella sp.]
MHKLELHYRFGPEAPAQPGLVRNPLLDLLHAVQDSGSISGAARQLGLSYRHVWGELKRWEAELGHALIVWEKGQAARLSELGRKLLWAERQAQARLAPQIEALRADLERVYAMA